METALVGDEPNFVGDFIDELPGAGYTFVAIHPDGSVSKPTGNFVSCFRELSNRGHLLVLVSQLEQKHPKGYSFCGGLKA